MRDADLTFVSQVSHRDILMYLIAIKSVYRFFDAGRIVVLDDGSLTDEDRVLLTHHLPSIRVVTFGQVHTARTPRGGCWERLLLISSLVRHSYVIQVDSDSLTLQEVSEVLDCVSQNWNFTLLGAGSFPAIESMRDACNRARRNGQSNTEPQGISERSLDRFPECHKLKYVRGSAAFSGFARDSFGSADVEYFSKNMEAICGPHKWREWGSEQVTSNLVIANSAQVCVLQHPKYTSYFALPDVNYSRSSFVHFIGIHRFRKGCYSKLARQTIRGLTSKACNRAGFDPYTQEHSDTGK